MIIGIIEKKASGKHLQMDNNDVHIVNYLEAIAPILQEEVLLSFCPPAFLRFNLGMNWY